jgi:glycosyltransferase involved in cell wall biosynthesis
MLKDINACVLIPTYNNEKTLENVIQRTLTFVEKNELWVINDGSTDETAQILKQYSDKINVLNISPNQGKGNALKMGFRNAIELGFENAITIDSDGQHFPEDIPLLIQAAKELKGCVVMGSRDMEKAGAPGKNSFGNKFSNFWFKVETGITLPDTQTGFRIYPLAPIKGMKFFTTKFEFEIETIVRLAWKGVPFKAVPINVLYDMENRVSHFRPLKDFSRISVLNTFLVIIAFFYYYPSRIFSKKTWEVLKEEAIKPNESNFSKAFSIGFGVFVGIIPIWGFQTLTAFALAFVFNLNKVLVSTAVHISIPPMIPIVIFCSYQLGKFFIKDNPNQNNQLVFSLNSIQENFTQYCVGAVVLALAMCILTTVVSYLILSIFRKKIVQS